MDILLLRFDAPLMSFGGVMVDQHGPTERFPGVSLLAGLFGNALGYTHGEADKLEALQARIEYAARWDIAPEHLLDYHTVDLGPLKDEKPDQWFKMREAGWTTHGTPEHRGGGDAAKYGTHIRYRHYWANGVMTVAVALDAKRPHPSPLQSQTVAQSRPFPRGEEIEKERVIGDAPGLQRLADALEKPARPLFIGRKTCLPAAPLLLDLIEAESVLDALADLEKVPLAERAGQAPPNKLEACWPAYLGEPPNSRTVPIYDRRDWRNQIHAGRRLRIEGLLECTT